MRRFLAALALLAACTPTDPIPPDDAGPCNGTCGAGTACVAGQCVTVDGGTPGPLDTPATDNPPPPTDNAAVVDAGPGDAGVSDAGADVPADTGCPMGWAVCDPTAVPVRCVDLSRGDRRDGGTYYSCGRCGMACATGEVCEEGQCVR